MTIEIRARPIFGVAVGAPAPRPGEQREGWDDAGARALFAPSVALPRMKKDLARLALDHGECAVESGVRAVQHGTLAAEPSEAVFQLRCKDAPLEIRFSVDDKTGQIVDFSGHGPRAPDAVCWQ